MARRMRRRREKSEERLGVFAAPHPRIRERLISCMRGTMDSNLDERQKTVEKGCERVEGERRRGPRTDHP
jgi:hypothetical protein